jgi:osmoprotectant transport system ATP-binding protein
MIRLDHITKVYDGVVAVADLSFDVSDGSVCVLIGPSGCGKTTTLRMVNRLVEPTSGDVYVNGQNTRTFRGEQLRRSIGYAIQNVGLFPHMTVIENIAVVPRLLHWGKARIEQRCEELLAMVGLNFSVSASKYPHQLSGGEAQRVGVARALAADPPILLMDEPFGAVDPLTRERLQTQFVRIQQKLKKTVIFVTHDLDEAIRLADRIAIMESGRLVQYDSPEAVLSHPAGKFVRDFVGTDRALKRLSRIGVRKFLKPGVSVRVDARSTQAIAGREQYRWFWVVDEKDRLVGWADRDDLRRSASVREAAHFADASEIALDEDATLREGLSRMLGLGFKFVPVVDEQGTLVGELALGDVESATRDGGQGD